MSENQAIAKEEQEKPEDVPGPEALEEQIRQQLLNQIAAQIAETEEVLKKQKHKRYEEAAQVLLLFVCFVCLIFMIFLIRSGGTSIYQSAILAIRPEGSGYARDLTRYQNSESANPQLDSNRQLERRR